MKTICFYISDYGNGHVSCSIVRIRKILSRYKQHYVHIDPNYSNSRSEDILSCLQEFIA